MSKLISCKVCQNQVAKSAKRCPSCGAKNKNKNGLIIGVAVVIFIFMICIATSNDSPTSVNSTATLPSSIVSEVEYLIISPQDLVTAYDENVVAADNKYKGKNLQITGTIGNIDNTFDQVSVTIQSGEIVTEVRCYFKNNNLTDVAELKVGDEVTIVGKCDGKLIFDVALKNCDVIK